MDWGLLYSKGPWRFSSLALPTLLFLGGCTAVELEDLPTGAPQNSTATVQTTPSQTQITTATATPPPGDSSATPSTTEGEISPTPTATSAPDTPTTAPTATESQPVGTPTEFSVTQSPTVPEPTPTEVLGTPTDPPTPTAEPPTPTRAPTPTPIPTPPLFIDADEDGTYQGQDCDDENAQTYPGAEEICDEADNDCDGRVEEGLVDDQDGDGATLCTGDCDDLNALASPLHSYEQFDQIDNDCDGQVDETQDVDEAPFIRSGDDNDSDGWCGATGGNIGDLDGDGAPEFAVGCPLENGQRGAVSIYYSHQETLSPEDEPAVLHLRGDSTSSYGGFSMATRGDFNGDNIPDIAIGQPFYPSWLLQYGAVTLALGDGSRRTGEMDMDQVGSLAIGTYIAAAGYALAFADHNNDGLDDLFIGAPYEAYGDGKSFVLYGTQDELPESFNVVDRAVLVERYFDNDVPASLLGGFGSAMANVGDLDGDGYEDVVIGGYLGATLGDLGDYCYACGAVQIVYGGPREQLADVSHSAVIGGEGEYDWFGHSVAPAGDLNHDGYSDFFVGAPEAFHNGNISGKVYAVYGGPNRLSGTRFVQDLGIYKGPEFTCPRDDCQLGYLYTMHDLGDVNGDYYSDFALGAIGYDPSNNGSLNNAGITALFYGGPEGFGHRHSVLEADAIFVGKNPSDNLGSVQYAGDLNGDGFNDMLTGAYKAEASGLSDGGEGYLFYGYGARD